MTLNNKLYAIDKGELDIVKFTIGLHFAAAHWENAQVSDTTVLNWKASVCNQINQLK